MLRRLIVIILAVMLAGCSSSSRSNRPAIAIHAHNDYAHQRPLYDALDAGAQSVEADVFLVNGDLLVAHEFSETDPAKTLRSLYLIPLQRRIEAHHGSVYGDGKTLNLLIDIKSDSAQTYEVIASQLKAFSPMLTHYINHKKSEGPITVILTGYEPSRGILLAVPDRLEACDGVLSDLTTKPIVDLVPIISSNWNDTFAWHGRGPIPPNEASQLKTLATQSHAQGRTLRFWGAPDTPEMWQQLRSAGVDWINTDRLSEVSTFLKSK